MQHGSCVDASLQWTAAPKAAFSCTYLWECYPKWNQLMWKKLKKPNEAYIFERVPTWHLLLDLLLQLLPSTYGLLVSGKIWNLLEPGVCEVLRKVLTTALVGWEQLLKKAHSWILRQKLLDKTSFHHQLRSLCSLIAWALDATKLGTKLVQIISTVFIKQSHLECTDRLLTLTAS